MTQFKPGFKARDLLEEVPMVKGKAAFVEDGDSESMCPRVRKPSVWNLHPRSPREERRNRPLNSLVLRQDIVSTPGA